MRGSLRGDLTIGESAAIVTYLAETYGGGGRTALIPTAPQARAKYFEWLSFICMELDATSLYILRRHEYLPEIYGEAEQAVTSSKAYFARMIEAGAQLYDTRSSYLLSDAFSGVDILMTTGLAWAVRYGQPQIGRAHV